MKNLKFLGLIILAIVTFWSCEKEPIEADLINKKPTELTAHKSKLQNRVLQSECLIGNFVGNSCERKLQIYTPPGYKKNGDQQYPVVYLLHGFPFSEKSFIDESVWDEWITTPNFWTQEYPDFPEEGFRLWIDKLIADEVIEPMIIVMPNALALTIVLNSSFEGFLVIFKTLLHSIMNDLNFTNPFFILFHLFYFINSIPSSFSIS